MLELLEFELYRHVFSLFLPHKEKLHNLVVELDARAMCPTAQFSDVMCVGNGRLGNGCDALLLYLRPGKLSLLIASALCIVSFSWMALAPSPGGTVQQLFML